MTWVAHPIHFMYIQTMQSSSVSYLYRASASNAFNSQQSLANSVHTYEVVVALPHMAPPATLVVSTPPGVSLQKQRDAGGHRQRRLDELCLQRVFDTFDRDGDGVITPAELSGALGRLGLSLGVPAATGGSAAGALDAVVEAYVAPGMAGLRFVDFLALHADLAATGGGGGDHDAALGKEDEEMREAFRVFDEDGDGYISAAELQAVLTRMGMPEAGCLARVRDMIAAADRNSDGRVDFDEFKAMMAGAANV
jgi:calcium-binding protein CML